MAIRYYSIAEVNNMLPRISPLIEEFVLRRRLIEFHSKEMSEPLTMAYCNIGGPVASKIARELVLLERLSERIEAFGCQIKDRKNGTIDFLSINNGREVYLCWQSGERPQIEQYHTLDGGFKGRQPITASDNFWQGEH